jgi:MFS family permease
MTHRAPNRRDVLLITSLSNFLTPFMGSAISVALPAIGREFHLKAVSLTWVMMAYLLATAVFLLPFGRLADLRGRSRIFRTGLLLYTVVSILLAVAPSGGLLIAFRAAQGLGSAMIFCTATPILLAAVPPSERGRALGINVAAVYLGLSLGPVLGGLLTQHAGWHSLFWVTAVLGNLTLALAYWKLPPERGGSRAGRFDLPGAGLYSAAILSFAVAASLLPGPWGIGLLAAGAAGLVGFVRWEIRTPDPLLAVSLFRGNPVFVFSNLAALINYAASSAVGVLLSLYLQNLQGLGPGTTGLVLLTQPVLMTAFSPLAGRLSDRVEPRIVATLGMGVMTAGLGVLSFVTAETPLPLVIGTLGLLGLGFAFFSSPNTNAVMGAAPPASYGVASAILSTMRLAGHVVSMGLVMVFLALFVGPRELTPEANPLYLSSLRMAFPVLAGLGVAGMAASLARGNVRRGAPPPSPPAAAGPGNGRSEG